MRFSNRFSLKPQEGKQRIKRKFLLIPRTFESEQTRWLEYANIVEEVQYVVFNEGFSCEYRWSEIGFADEIESLTSIDTSKPFISKGAILTDEQMRDILDMKEH